MSKYSIEYNEKKVTADEAVKIVKSGDRVSYGIVAAPTIVLDQALANRRGELKDVQLLSACMMHYAEAARLDPDHSHFTFNDISFSAVQRKMHDDNVIFHIPELLHETPEFYRRRAVDVAFVAVTPMDENGYFNLSIQGINTAAALHSAKQIVVEVHDTLPYVNGRDQWLHISNITHIVEVTDSKLPICIPEIDSTDIDKKIASYILEVIEDGACLQLGVGGIPNYVGKMIAQSDIKDIGVHTELLCDAYVDMFEAGKITNKLKTLDKGVTICTFILGTKKLYDFVHRNPLVNIYPTDYTNNPRNIMQNDKVISICGCLNVDIVGQISSESIGRRQVSGTGGQLDFHYAAYHSKGGKGILCLPSARFNKNTNKYESNIVSSLVPGTIVTTPSSVSSYIVTEYGMVNLKGKSTWERAEALISISHPECQDELVVECQKAKIWRQSNKR